MDQPRDTHAPILNVDVDNHVRRLRRHSPVSGVGVARRSYGYVVATASWIRGCGDRNAARRSSPTGF